MSVAIRVDTSAATPPYEQVRAQLAGLIAAGTLRPGDRLPTVRALAADLGIAPNTVARAFKELEATGVVVTGRRAGTVVAEGVASSYPAPRRDAEAFARTAVAAGLDDGTALDLVRTALAAARQR